MSKSADCFAKYYDYIFPYNPLQLEFLEGKLPDRDNLSILDLGCGTGNLALALAEAGHSVVGIDVDPSMIDVANEKAQEFDNKVTFLVEDMEKIQRSFKAESFDVIYSFGNSIIQLPNSDAIEDLFAAAKPLLKPNGVFVGQMINYRRIFAKRVTGLPTIDNNHISYERSYQLKGPGENILSKTRLYRKDTREIEEFETSLYPLLPEEALFMLENAGFGSIELYGAFNGDNYSNDSYSFIFVAK